LLPIYGIYYDIYESKTLQSDTLLATKAVPKTTNPRENQKRGEEVRLAKDMLANSVLVITLLKEEIHVLVRAQPLTVETFERIQGVRRRIYDSDDYQEGIRSFFEKRKPVFQGKCSLAGFRGSPRSLT
jgi:enoyl-CoA hydratase/carnithine racemase